ncbi:hypothetical protein EPO04_01885 [Patescibacteria group bacterium]|nr:MAG: hypothetical protein EPO04_01885 [Patescibacteria group bacterium]
MGNSELQDLVELRDEMRRRFDEDDFDDRSIDQASKLIRDRWAAADPEEAAVLADIMAATPNSAWMREFLVPAEHGEIANALVLLARYSAIASAFGEGVAREDGLTRRV